MLTLLASFILLKFVEGATSYQHVQFFENKPFLPSYWPASFHKVPSDFNHFSEPDFWPYHHQQFDNYFDITLESPNYHFENEHFFEPDPYLLTGHKAKIAVSKLNARGKLFYKDIPHIRALLKLQEKRINNGLAPNKLGSLNPKSPFAREKALSYFYPKPHNYF